MKILHLSDIHFGKKLSWLGEKAGDHRKRIWQTFEKALNHAIDKNIEVIIITGDIFDNPFPDSNEVKKFKDKLNLVTEKGVDIIILPGNHDRAEEGSVWQNFQESDRIKIFKSDGYRAIDFPEKKLKILGKAITTQKSSKSPLSGLFQALEAQDQSDYTKIVMAHGGVDISQGDNHTITKDELKKLKQAGISYLALGDWHGLKQIPEGEIPIWYPGSLEFLDRNQNSSGFGLVVDIDTEKKLAKVKKERFSDLKLLKKTFSLNQVDKDIIENELKTHADSNTIATFEISGTTDLDNKMSKFIEHLQNEFTSKYYHLKIVDQSDLKVDSSDLEDFPEGSIPHKFITLVAEKTESGELDSELGEEVLELGIRTITE